MTKPLKCDDCGKFISYRDLEKGKATRILSQPDSYFTAESYITLCKDCVPEQEEN